MKRDRYVSRSRSHSKDRYRKKKEKEVEKQKFTKTYLKLCDFPYTISNKEIKEALNLGLRETDVNTFPGDCILNIYYPNKNFNRSVLQNEEKDMNIVNIEFFYNESQFNLENSKNKGFYGYIVEVRSNEEAKKLIKLSGIKLISWNLKFEEIKNEIILYLIKLNEISNFLVLDNPYTSIQIMSNYSELFKYNYKNQKDDYKSKKVLDKLLVSNLPLDLNTKEIKRLFSSFDGKVDYIEFLNEELGSKYGRISENLSYSSSQNQTKKVIIGLNNENSIERAVKCKFIFYLFKM